MTEMTELHATVLFVGIVVEHTESADLGILTAISLSDGLAYVDTFGPDGADSGSAAWPIMETIKFEW